MNIKIKYHNQNCKITKLGDWIDLRAAETVEIEAPKVKYCINRENWCVAKSLFADFFSDCNCKKEGCCK